MSRIFINGSFLPKLKNNMAGVYRYGYEISRALKRLSCDIEIISPAGYPPYVKDELLPSNYELSIRLMPSMASVWEQLELRQFLKTNRNPLLLNLTNTGPISYTNQWVTIHDLMFLENPNWYSKKHYYYYKTLFKHLCDVSQGIFTVSDFSKQDIIRQFKIRPDKIHVIYNAVHQQFFQGEPINESFSEHIQSLGDYVLSVSGLHPRKNFPRLIQAFRSLKEKELKLVIVGPPIYGQYAQELQALAEPGQIHFTGFVDDQTLSAYYRHARLFVFPSLYEGFGIPPLEAMASGCPTVVSNVTSLPEVCGEAACYVDPLNVESIAFGMRKVLSDNTYAEHLRDLGTSEIIYL